MSRGPDAEDVAVAGCMGALGAFVLVLVAIVFVGCPMAMSYGAARGCAAASEFVR